MSHEPGPGGYEKSDLTPKPILTFGVILAVVTVAAMVAVYGMVRLLGWWEAPRLETPASPLATRAVPAEPRLQVDAPKALRTLQAGEDAALSQYGWVNKEAGLARIPIERAMQLLVERGLPAPQGGAATPPAQGTR